MRHTLALVAILVSLVLSGAATTVALTACIDNDGDGFGVLGDPSCPAGPVPDCHDGYATVYPGAPEICDGLNNDCDHPHWPEVAYWHEQVIATVANLQDVFAADLDGDGDTDALSARHDGQVRWHENAGGDGSQWTTHVVSIVPRLETAVDGLRSVFAEDVDDDGDFDILTASDLDDRIVWLENTTGDASTWAWHLISNMADEANSVVAADVDGDDDVDVLSASAGDSKVAWYENLSGDGSAWVEHVITTTAFDATSVRAADVDGDGDMDALSASYADGVLAWHENTAGDGSEWTEHQIGTASGARSVFPVDLDDDGDQDVLLGAYWADTVAWYENSSGDGSSWVEHAVNTSANGATSVFAADIDDDDDLDVLSASALNFRISWYWDFFGDGTTWIQEPISTTADGAIAVFAADVDGDDDADVLSASAGNDKVAWYAWLSVEADDDGDGLAECEGDCDDANPRCGLDCSDSDGDGFCVTTDCDDTTSECTTDCGADTDGDGVLCVDDCDDGNPHCTTDCTDTDGDGACVTTDCDDSEPQCTLDCNADADGDGVSCLDDCHDLDECIGVVCDDPLPGCGPYCPDGVTVSTLPDSDEDGTPDCEDNCPLTPNDQSDADWNRVGDACDCGLTVTTTADGDDGECEIDCTLREALSLATTGCAIGVPAGTYALELGYLPLEVDGTIDTMQLSLFGVGAGYTVLDGTGSDPTLGVSNPAGEADLYVGGLSITNSGSGDGVTVVNVVHPVREVRLNHVEFTGILDNRAVDVGSEQSGSGVINYTLSHSTITGNSTGIHVRGHYSGVAGACLLSHCEVHDNPTGIRVGAGGTVGIVDSSVQGSDTGIWAEGGDPHYTVGGRATIDESTISGNADGIVAGGGGPQHGDGATVILYGSEVRGNSGTGISLGSGCSEDCTGARATLRRCTVRDNGDVGLSIEGFPGSGASTNLQESTISGNLNGGIYNDGELVALNITISGNSTEGPGGGIYNNNGEANLNFTTVAENHAALGGGIYNANGTGGVQIANTAIANNTADQGPDCAWFLSSNDYNLVENVADCTIVGGTGDIVGVDPLLGPLHDNGGVLGRGRTHLPRLASPLVEAGNPAPYGSGDYACHYADQRYLPRPGYTWCDIGAVEHRPGDCEMGDLDGDRVCEPDDNCPGAPNPDQGPAALGQTVHAANAEEFVWGQAVDVVRLRGDLDLVGVYSVDWTDTIAECDSLVDADEPDPESGFYYLVRPDCALGSWQTVPGMQPDRDSMLP